VLPPASRRPVSPARLPALHGKPAG